MEGTGKNIWSKESAWDPQKRTFDLIIKKDLLVNWIKGSIEKNYWSSQKNTSSTRMSKKRSINDNHSFTIYVSTIEF